MTLPVAILAGGLATRLRPVTDHLPKSLIEVAGKPFVFHQLDLLCKRGIERVVFCLGYRGQQIVDAVGNGRKWGMQIQYIFDGPVQLGTAGALKRATHILGDIFLVLYGDSYLDCDYRKIASSFMFSGKSGLMTVIRNRDEWDRSNVVFANGVIERYDKGRHSPEMDYIDYGLGGLRAEALDPYPGGPLDLVVVYNDLIARKALLGIEVLNRFYEIGSKKGIDEINAYLTTRTNES